MLRNYLKIAWRNLWRHRTTTAINLVGLAVSLAVCFLVMLFVYEQWTLDRFHPHSEQIYHVASTTEGRLNATAPAPLAQALRESAPEAAAVTRLGRKQTTFVVQGETSVQVSAVYADSSFFDVFSGFRLQAGNRATAFKARNTAVLTPDAVRRIFGPDALESESIVGKTFSLRGEDLYTVAGVLAPPPGPTHLTSDIFLSNAGGDDQTGVEAWSNIYSRTWTYVRLREGAVPADLEQTATQLFRDAVPKDQRSATGDFEVLSLSDLRFGGAMQNPLSLRTQIPGYLFYFFLTLAVVILVAAGFNYVNLTTAYSLQRTKEIGVRKTVGASRAQLAGQFLGEAVVTCLLGGVGAYLLLPVLLPVFNDLYLWTLLDLPPLSARPWEEPFLLFLCGGVALLLGLAAGLYPALVLSRSRPQSVLGVDASISSPFGTLSVRKVLIGAQFAFALLLLVTATTMYRQSAKMADTTYDLKTERLVSIDLQDVDYERFRTAARRLDGVASVAALDPLFMGTTWFGTELRRNTSGTPLEVYYHNTDTTLVQDAGLRLKATRADWTVPFTNGSGLLLNESAVSRLGFAAPSDAVGATVYWGNPDEDSVATYSVVGVVDDFQYTGAPQVYTPRGREASPPLALRSAPTDFNHAVVLAAGNDVAGVRDRLASMWTSAMPTDHPFEARLYSEFTQMRNGPMQDLASIASFVSVLAILITLLGLLSIAAHSVETRTKEIGVRKALGATLSSLVVLLSRNFLILVGVAVAAALPVAWWLNTLWLQFLPDPVSVASGGLALAVGGLLLLALFTVGSQTLRAARLDPATTLRDE